MFGSNTCGASFLNAVRSSRISILSFLLEAALQSMVVSTSLNTFHQYITYAVSRYCRSENQIFCVKQFDFTGRFTLILSLSNLPRINEDDGTCHWSASGGADRKGIISQYLHCCRGIHWRIKAVVGATVRASDK